MKHLIQEIVKMYYSFTPEEFGIMTSMATGDETLLYIALRKFADFRTGLMTHPAAGRLNYSFLARMLSRDSRQGCEERIFTHVEIKRFLERLMHLGLVADIARKGRALMMRLPFVAFKDKEAQITSKKLSGKTPSETGRLSGSCSEPKQSEKPVNAGSLVKQEMPGKARLSGQEKQNQARLSGTENDNSRETPTTQRIASDKRDSLSTSTKPSVQNPPIDAGEMKSPSAHEKTDNAASRLVVKTERTEQTTSGNPFRDLVEHEGQGLIRYAGSEISLKIYRSWEACRFDIRDVRDAVRDVLKKPWFQPTPNSIDALLRAAMKPTIKGKGSLCL